MTSIPFLTAFLCRMTVLAFSFALIAGCQTGPEPQQLAENAIEKASGVLGAVTFRSEAGPLNEPFQSRAGASDRLSLAQAAEQSLKTDPSLQIALARVRVAIAELDQSRLLPNPILNVVLRWPSSGATQVELSLVQDLISLLKRPRRISAADKRLQAALSDAVTVALDVIEEVQVRYLNIQAFDALIPVLDERLGIIRRMLGIARDRLAVGEGVRSDVTTLDAQRVGVEVDLAEAGRQRREERLRLARLLGEPSSQAEWALEPWTPSNLSVTGEETWINAALAQRPEIQSISYRLAALGDEAVLTRFIPFDGAAAGVNAERAGAWPVGPSVSTPVPLLDMGQARRARVSAEQLEARHELNLTQRKIVEEVRVALSSFAAIGANLRRVREELVPLETQRRDQAEGAFLGGQTDAIPLFLAEQDLRAARVKAIETERQAATAAIRLYRAVGGQGIAASVAVAPPSRDSDAAPSRN